MGEHKRLISLSRECITLKANCGGNAALDKSKCMQLSTGD